MNRKLHPDIIDCVFVTDFELEYVFCSCMDKHDKNCANFGKTEPDPNSYLYLSVRKDDKIVPIKLKIQFCVDTTQEEFEGIGLKLDDNN